MSGMTVAAIVAAEAGTGISSGEWLVSVTAVVLALISVAATWATWKLTRVTAQVATIEMRKVATNANDDMRDVAVAHIHDDEVAR